MIEDKAKELGRLIGQSSEYKAVKRANDLLGEDNLSGKMLQLKEIDASADRFVRGDWLTFASRCSPDFVDRVTGSSR